MLMARRAGRLALAFAWVVVTSAGVTAQTEPYPARLIRIVIPFAPGGPNDVIGRPLADKMSETLGQSIIIENRPGAGGRTATLMVARSDADGYTVLMTTNSHVANQALYAKLAYDALKDFAPVTLLAENYGLAMVARANLPVKDIRDFVAQARGEPGKFSYAHAGVGNATHIAGVLLEKLAGIEMLAVPYKGSGSYISDVIGGQVDATFVSTALALPNIQSGLLKPLASTGPNRVPNMPTVPTMMEIGYRDFDWLSYYGLYVPAGTARDRIDKLHAAAIKALDTPELRRILDDAGVRVMGTTPDAFAAYLAKDLIHQRAVAKRIGMQLQ